MKPQSIDLESVGDFYYKIKDKTLRDLTSSDVATIVKYENELAFIECIGVCKGRGLQAVRNLKAKLTARRICLLAELEVKEPCSISFNQTNYA